LKAIQSGSPKNKPQKHSSLSSNDRTSDLEQDEEDNDDDDECFIIRDRTYSFECTRKKVLDEIDILNERLRVKHMKLG
jgi:hypothetical protein